MADNVLPFPIQPSNDNSVEPLPPCPAVALVVGSLMLHLGGTLTICTNGKRYSGRPEPIVFRLNESSLPQPPGAKPWERFHCDQEWRGAFKLLDYLFTRLAPSDQNYLFDTLAVVAVDPANLIPSIEEPTRSAA